jgi:type II secretory pathway component GspD/PulD (secretin)
VIDKVTAQPPAANKTPAKDTLLQVIGDPTIEEALDKVIDLEFKDTPLERVADELTNRTGLTYVLPKQILGDAAISLNAPVSYQSKGLKLQFGLDLMLNELQLTWIVRDGAIVITTVDDAERRGFVRVYPVSDLIDREAATGAIRGIEPDRLIDLITTSIARESWEEVGGQGCIEILASDRLIVRQTLHVHFQVAELLRLLRRVREDHSKENATVTVPLLAFKDDMGLDRQQNSRVSLDFHDVPLESVLDSLARQMKLPIHIDRRQIAGAGIDPTANVSIHVKEVAPKAALSLLLHDLDLTWRDAGQAIIIATHEDSARRPSIRIYPVYDLIPRQSELELRYGHDGLDELIDAITTTIEPDSWDEVGGEGTIESVVPWPALVVAQTPAVHNEITDLLARLRAAGMPLAAKSPSFDPSKPIRRIFPLRKADVQESYTSGSTQTVRKSRASGTTADEIVKQLRLALPSDQWNENARMTAIDDKVVIEAPPAIVAKVEDLLNELWLIEHGGSGGGSGFGPWPGLGPGAFRP